MGCSLCDYENNYFEMNNNTYNIYNNNNNCYNNSIFSMNNYKKLVNEVNYIYKNYKCPDEFKICSIESLIENLYIECDNEKGYIQKDKKEIIINV